MNEINLQEMLVNDGKFVVVAVTKIDDKELLETAIVYGRNALEWRRKFIGLLPEINKRKLFEKKNCQNIFEFAAKFGGLSHDQVKLAINLEERFENMPSLHEALVSGEVSINKLARVASIATPENEGELFGAVSNLSHRAVETFVRDEKQNGLDKPEIEAKSVHVHDLHINEEVSQRLFELQEKGIDINEIILVALNKREEEISEEKSKLSEEAKSKPAKSRPLPARTEKLIEKEHGTKCSIPTCNKPSTVIHHTQMFALSHIHDPNYLAPLCDEHHEIAHAINLLVREKRFAR